MLRGRHGSGKILILHCLICLSHRRLDKPLAPAGGGAFRFSQLHDAQQLIAEAGKLPAQQTGRIFQPPLPPYPAVPFQRQPDPRHRRAEGQQSPAQPSGRFHHPVQDEHQQIGNGEPKNSREQSLH